MWSPRRVLPRLRFVLLFLVSLACRADAQEDPPTLRVVSPALPRRWAPGMALNDSERQALDLVFESLLVPVHDPEHNLRYRPGLAERLPAPEGVQRTLRIRPTATWSTGVNVTAADVRYTLRLLQRSPGASLAWSTMLEPAQLGPSAREVRVTFRHGLIQPEEWFTFPVLPQLHEGRQLERLDDPAFAKKPVGSGPFQVEAVLPEKGSEHLLLKVNPHHEAASRLPFRQIRWFASQDLARDLPRFDPDLVLGFDAESLAAGKKAGLRTLESATTRVLYLAINQRHPALKRLELRRFLGLSLHLDPSVNGLAPRESWAVAPPPRVPEKLEQPQKAQMLARELATSAGPVRLTLKFPDSSPILTRLLTEVVQAWDAAAKSAKLDLQVELRPQSPTAHADALHTHDFDLALAWEDHGTEIGRLLALFDPHEDARKPGGSNFLGVQDPVLQGYLLALPKTRQFPLLRERMHSVHVHLIETMPLIPLRLQTVTLGQSSRWRMPILDPLRPFLDLANWRSPAAAN